VSSEIAHCLRIIEDLIQVFDNIEHYISEEHLWDEATINQMHLERQTLTTELVKSLPSPTPSALEGVLVKLQGKTRDLLAHIGTSQNETRDAVFKLQNYRKAKQVYQNVGLH
jgi:hypothetical protein